VAVAVAVRDVPRGLDRTRRPDRRLYEEPHRTFEALGAVTKIGCLFFATGPENGIHTIHWGDAHLEPDRTFTRLCSEQLQLPPGSFE
jgi:hypothetical protein